LDPENVRFILIWIPPQDIFVQRISFGKLGKKMIPNYPMEYHCHVLRIKNPGIKIRVKHTKQTPCLHKFYSLDKFSKI